MYKRFAIKGSIYNLGGKEITRHPINPVTNLWVLVNEDGDNWLTNINGDYLILNDFN
jgi:hypothetical protein